MGEKDEPQLATQRLLPIREIASNLVRVCLASLCGGAIELQILKVSGIPGDLPESHYPQPLIRLRMRLYTHTHTAKKPTVCVPYSPKP